MLREKPCRGPYAKKLMSGGAGSALGRMEKIRDYGVKPKLKSGGKAQKLDDHEHNSEHYNWFVTRRYHP